MIFFKRLKRAFRWFKYGWNDYDGDYDSICNIMQIKMKDILKEMINYSDLVKLDDQIKKLGKAIFYLNYWCSFDDVIYASKIIESKLGELKWKNKDYEDGSREIKMWYENEDKFNQVEQTNIKVNAYERGSKREEELKNKFCESFKFLKWWWV